MNIIVCFKQAVNEAEIGIDKTSKKLLMDGVPTKISEFDKNAIELAVKLKEAHGGTITAITVAPAEASKAVKEALAMGCDQAVHLSDPGFSNSDTYGTALILSASIRKLMDRFDLIICAEGSSDIYSSQVGPSVAELLDLPQLTYARRVTIEGDKVIGERSMEEGIEVVETSLPCVVTVTNEINIPRLPTLMQIMAASKKPVQRWTPAELGLTSEPIGDKANIQVKRTEALTVERKNKFISGSSAEEIAENLAEDLVREGVFR